MLARRCEVYSDHLNGVRYIQQQANHAGSKYAAQYSELISNMPATWHIHKVPAHPTARKLHLNAHIPVKAYIGNACADAMAKAAAAQAYPEEAAQAFHREKEKWAALSGRALAVYTRWREGPAANIPERPRQEAPPPPQASAYDRADEGHTA